MCFNFQSIDYFELFHWNTSSQWARKASGFSSLSLGLLLVSSSYAISRFNKHDWRAEWVFSPTKKHQKCTFCNFRLGDLQVFRQQLSRICNKIHLTTTEGLSRANSFSQLTLYLKRLKDLILTLKKMNESFLIRFLYLT